jgi:hypothetical protein
VKEFGEVMKTIMEGKGDLRDIHNAGPLAAAGTLREMRKLQVSE